MKKAKDGFGYDLDKALKQGNIFEKVFHRYRISPWLKKIDYSHRKVLDVGCNTGILLIPLLEECVNVIGVDISKEDIAKAKKKLTEKNLSPNRALVANAKKLPFKEGVFDIVLLSDILEHVSQPELVAKESCRVTKKGGYILATVPNEWHPVIKYPWLKKLLSGRKNIDEHPDIPFNLKKLIDLFPNTQVVECKYLSFWVQIFCKFKKN